MIIFVSKSVLERYDDLLEPKERFTDTYLADRGIYNRICDEDILAELPAESVLPVKYYQVMEREKSEEGETKNGNTR